MSYIDELRQRCTKAEEALEEMSVSQLRAKLDEATRYSAEVSGLLHSLLNAIEETTEVSR